MTDNSTIPAFEATNVQLEIRPRTLWGDAWSRIAGSKLALFCLIVTAIYVIAALTSFLPFFETTVNNVQSGKIWDVVGGSFQPPRWGTPAVWLGTDLFGHSIFWQTIYGSRVALEITIGASVLSIGIGVILGVVAGYFGGWVDNLIIWLFTTVNSVPWIVLVIAVAYALEAYSSYEVAPNAQSLSDHILNAYLTVNGWFSGMLPVILALGLTDWVGLCRLIRGEVLTLRERDFVTAAKAVGLRNSRILFRHIIPNVSHIVIITFSLGVVGYVQAEVVLSFLGLGVTNKPSWGQMIDSAKLDTLRGVWWPATAATIAILIICLVLNYLGDILRDALDPRLRGVN
jgi:ABC-type dipeptide/oligopeptide/nickel transport system permease subunit